MENLLLKIVGECGSKRAALKTAAQETHDEVVAQQVNAMVDMHVLRERVLAVVEGALDAGGRLQQCGVEALQLLLRDNQLHSLEGAAESAEQSLPLQVLHTLHCLPDWHHDPDVQCHCLTVILQMLCSSNWSATPASLTTAVDLCLSCFDSTRAVSVRMAARATVTQVLSSYCTGLYKEQAEDAADDDFRLAFEQITQLLSFCVDKVSRLSSDSNEPPSLLLLIEAVATILHAQSLTVLKHEPFVTLLWRDLCPAVVAMIGSPQQSPRGADEQIGRGCTSAGSRIFEPELARSVYALCVELLRLMGPLAELRSSLEALFFKAYLYPPVKHRLEAIRSIKKMLGSVERVVDIILDLTPSDIVVESAERGLALWRILLDCVVECSYASDVEIAVAAVQSCDHLLASLAELCDDGAPLLSPDAVGCVNEQMPSLSRAAMDEFVYERSALSGPAIDVAQLLADAVSPVESPTQADGAAAPTLPTDEDQRCLDSVAERIALVGGGAARQSTPPVSPTYPPDATERFKQSEVSFANEFVAAVAAQFSPWGSIRSLIELDQEIQKFSLQYAYAFAQSQELALCKDVTARVSVLNADAIYLTIYSLLRLCRNTQRVACEATVTAEEFVRCVSGSGCVVYASDTWLRAVYSAAMALPCLQVFEAFPFAALVEDFDGTSCQLMSDVERLECAASQFTITQQGAAARKLSRRVLTASWQGLVAVLSGLLDAVRDGAGRSLAASVVRLRAPRSDALLVSDGVSAALSGLQRLAHLCSLLQLRCRSGWIFRRIVEVSCPLDDLRKSASALATERRAQKVSLRRLDALSIELILDSALVAASHAPDCWSSVLRCAEYVLELERYFIALPSAGRSVKAAKGKAAADCALRRATGDDDEDGASSFGLLPVDAPAAAQESVLELLAEANVRDGSALEPSLVCRAVSILVGKVDRFYESVGNDLNLAALLQFLSTAVTTSQGRLIYSSTEGGLVERWSTLQRLRQLVLRAARSSRPLVHQMFVWSAVVEHFVEVACGADAAAAEKAVGALHETIDAFLGVRVADVDGFHLHEALVQPLQRVLCAEPCAETEDQIVCAVADLVEMHADAIGTAWRPLFGTLKAVRLHKESASASMRRMHNTVLQVFGAFLKTENWGLFCSAALDCIACLLHYLQSSVYSECSESDSDVEDGNEGVALGKPALGLLQRFHALLESLYNMNALPVLHLLRRLLLRERLMETVDRSFSLAAPHELPPIEDGLRTDGLFAYDQAFRPTWQPYAERSAMREMPWARLTPTQSAVVEVWLSLLEGLVGAVSHCALRLQPPLLQFIFDACHSFRNCPGVPFGVYCLRAVVAPMLQQWLRREAAREGGCRDNSPSVRNLKQAVGLLSECVVAYVSADAEAALPLLEDVLALLVECVGQPSEFVSRFGCSCLRHVIVSAADGFSAAYWDAVVSALWQSLAASVHALRLLMTNFTAGSHAFYGDGDTVQVALRKDSNPREASRVRALAQQVFLLDSQKFTENLEDRPDLLSQSNRSVILLLQSSEDELTRLPFRDIVVGLLSHQLLLQLIGTLLLERSDLTAGGISTLLLRPLRSPLTPSSTTQARPLSGFLSAMDDCHVRSLLTCLDASFHVAHEFDRRPGLKFLLQRVFNSPVAANLYKQAVTAWSVKLLTQFELGRHRLSSPPDDTIQTDAASSPFLLTLSDDYLRVCDHLGVLEKECRSLQLEQCILPDEPRVEFLLASPEALAKGPTDADSSDHDKHDDDASTGDRKAAETEEETVYKVVSTDELSGLLSEYRRRKQQSVMPPKPPPRPNPFGSDDAAAADDREAAHGEQRQSIVRDADARGAAWAEMATSLLQLLLGQPDALFRRLVPLFYPAVVHLIANSAQPRVRQALADLVFKLNEVYRFAAD